MCLELLAGLAADRDDGARCARLLGAAQSLCHTFGLPSFGSSFCHAEQQQRVEHARRLLGEPATPGTSSSAGRSTWTRRSRTPSPARRPIPFPRRTATRFSPGVRARSPR